MELWTRVYLSKHAENIYREITRLSNPRGESLVQGFYEVSNIGSKRYHLNAIWVETQKSTNSRLYRYQEDLINAIENKEDHIVWYTEYNSPRTLPFEIVDDMIQKGDLKVLDMDSHIGSEISQIIHLKYD